MTRRPRGGMTLVEVLIAVSLLSLLSVSILTTLRVGVNALDKTNSVLIANRRAVSVERILERQLAGFIPAYADCPQPGNMPPVRTVFFEGHPNSMRFASGYSLQEAGRGTPQILEFQVIAADEGRGVRLIVNEFVYTGPRSAGAACMGMETVPEWGVVVPRFQPVNVGPRSFVLADKLATCRFVYREPVREPLPDRWVPDWRLPVWPSAIRVEMEQLSPDPARAPLIGVTVPVRINRQPMTQYVDE